jgi:thioredoxin 1
MAHTFTDANFEQEVLKSEVPVVVDIWAEWCGPCRAMSPMIEEIAAEIPETKVKIGKMNADQNSMIPEKYEVASIPTFLVFKGGQLVDRFMGSMPKAAFMEHLSKHIR